MPRLFPHPAVFASPAALAGVAGKGIESIERALSLVPRLADLVTDAEALVARIGALADQIDIVVDEAAAVTGRLTPLLQELEPPLTRLQPVLARLAETTDPDEVDAVVTMVNLLPSVVDKFQADIVPVLDTLGTVAPDLRDLLDVSKELNELIGAIPGVGRVKRRIDEEEIDPGAYRADEEPPAAPDRG
jgi:ABC-type transporter Mla subunit MlaD